MALTRRQWLRDALIACGKLTGLSALVAGGHQLLGHKPRPRFPAIPGKYGSQGVRLIRPPGAVAEPDFLAGCIRCYRCQDACGPGAIQFFTEADGIHFHTPYVDPSVKACNLCMQCTQVCPTGVLRPMEQKQREQVQMATVELDPDRCLSYKAKAIRDEQALLMELGREPMETGARSERRGPCGECYMFCPLRERALQLEPGSFLAPLVFQQHCVGCGMCEEICRQMVRGEPAIRVVPIRGARSERT